ncbi:MAG: radical SAM protein [Ignavibacteriaceae bacterium]|nr:radical SAM protein [Ignavibacteriaceae bacterium]
MNGIIFFNPRSGQYNRRIPLSILQVVASIQGKYPYVIIDGNFEKDPWIKIENYLKSGEFSYFASTVMPGPQLKQAIPITKKIKELYPSVINIWGGYFASNHARTSILSGYMDYIIKGPGDYAFPKLLDALSSNYPPDEIENLIYIKAGEIVSTLKAEIPDQDILPPLPYAEINKFYSIRNYIGKTFLGSKTFAYHSSMGCPFTCAFCGIVPIFNARWKAKSAAKMYNDIRHLKDQYGINAIEFFDNNFFVSEKRVAEFSSLMVKEGINWWGESRIDTMNKYSDKTLSLMREAGCRMIFFGAESGNDELLNKMDKGGTQTSKLIKSFAARMKNFGIIPEYSFILGFPAETPQKVMKQIDDDIEFIKEIKEINPSTEIIIYIFSPVPTESSELLSQSQNLGFRFPQNLDDWLEPEWEKFDTHNNPLTPWLTSEMVEKIHNFETVLNGFYPTVSDYKLVPLQRKMIKTLSLFRYKNNIFAFPYEIKILQKFWLKYRRPEVEGFYME